MDFNLDKNEKITLLKAARDSIECWFRKESPSVLEATANLTAHCGAFVTLETKTGSLRGCIGFVEGHKPLLPAVQELARSSAFHDPRFQALNEAELKNILIEISVLSPLKRIKSIDEITVGKHGIMLRLGFRSGLLLPQVATEQGWDKYTFIKHTCYKAGLDGECWKNPEIEIDIFTALVFNERELNIVQE